MPFLDSRRRQCWIAFIWGSNRSSTQDSPFSKEESYMQDEITLDSRRKRWRLEFGTHSREIVPSLFKSCLQPALIQLTFPHLCQWAKLSTIRFYLIHLKEPLAPFKPCEPNVLCYTLAPIGKDSVDVHVRLAFVANMHSEPQLSLNIMACKLEVSFVTTCDN